MKESDIFRGEHPDTRSGSQWWAIVCNKKKMINGYITKLCKVCSTPFVTTPSNYKKTCSNRCSIINKNKVRRNRIGTKEILIKICRVCGNEFIGRQANQVACTGECVTKNKRNNTKRWKAAKAIV
jgi:predicted nucleic acid-binding Zn ribbon protein